MVMIYNAYMFLWLDAIDHCNLKCVVYAHLIRTFVPFSQAILSGLFVASNKQKVIVHYLFSEERIVIFSLNILVF